MSVTTTSGVRLDKWLWAARFFKTRSLAAEEIHKGRVSVNGTVAKAAREVRIGDTIALRQGNIPKTVQVLGLSHMRGPAPIAQQLYAETPESQQQRQQLAEQRRLAPEPAAAIAQQRQGRPTKRQRRDLDEARSDGWGERWSARWE
ncbi:RNA-binding S4 domain-containing protein [Comamonas nitrativorans]|uniref:RNA-binding S4 domain-containing protein n=1 Tax=Comamonas nitrativorans TaxID=108437 RepID=A0ABV9GU10_9BURK